MCNFQKSTRISSAILIPQFWVLYKPARIHSPDPFLRAGNIQPRFCQIQIPRKIVWQNRVRIVAPPPARSIEGRTPKKNILSFFRKILRENQSCKRHFSLVLPSVVGGCKSQGAWSVRNITDFEKRCELGKIKAQIYRINFAQRASKLLCLRVDLKSGAMPLCGRRAGVATFCATKEL